MNSLCRCNFRGLYVTVVKLNPVLLTFVDESSSLRESTSNREVYYLILCTKCCKQYNLLFCQHEVIYVFDH
jgi:hypothetical protein